MSQMIIWLGALKRIIPLVLLCTIVVACGSAPAAPQAVIQTQVVVVTSAPQVQTVEVEKQVVATPTPDLAAAASSEPIEMRALILCSPPVSEVFDVLLAGFGASHPNVTIKKECAGSGDYAEGIYAQAAANNLPDVFFSADIFTAPFVDAGVLLDMEEYAKGDDQFKLDDVYESILGLGRVEGQPGLYMIPASLDTVQMYYNKTLWEKAGAPLPTDKWTWDDLTAACKQVQKATEGVKCIGIGNTGGYGFDWWAYWVPWVRGYGGDVLSPDGKKSLLSSPDSLAGLQAYANLWAKDEIATPLGSDLGGDCFINQKCAAVFFIPGAIKNYKEKIGDTFQWDVQFTPAHPKGHFTGMGTFGFSIAKATKHPKEAWDFVKYLASPTGQRIITSSQIGVPLLKSMANDPVFQQLKPPPANMNAFIHGGDIGIFPRTYPVKCGSLYSGQVNTVIKNALEQVIRKAATVEEAFKAADTEIQSCLDSIQ
jgi:multiple sugar transport system substrate-binding protein